jgi:hypothetical protein
VANIGSTRLTKVDAGVLNGLYALLLSSVRMSSSRKGKGYEPDVVTRALALRAKGLTLVATAEQLRTEFTSAEHITKDTLASLLRRQASKATERPPGLDPRTVNYIHTTFTAPSRTPSAGADSPATRPTLPTRRAADKSQTAYKHGTPRHFDGSSTTHVREVIGSTARGCYSPRPACAEAKRSASAGAMSISTPADCVSFKP